MKGSQTRNKMNRKLTRWLFGMALITTSTANTYAEDTAQQKCIELKDVTSGTFSAMTMPALTTLADGASYAIIGESNKTIERYSFATGEHTGTLFDAATAKGDAIKGIDGYFISPDGQYIVIRTGTKAIYRRSYTAEHYIYNVKTDSVCRLSENGAQQVPFFSPNGRHVAFVRDNDIYITDMTSRTETRVTTDGRRNEVINGIPDWVNEEEFAFNRNMVFNASGNMLAWVRYDESNVKEYPLMLFKGAAPALTQNETYPSTETYKYPKAGEENSHVSLWAYDMVRKSTKELPIPLDSDGYIPRIETIPDCDDILVFTLNRHQDSLKIYKIAPHDGECRLIVEDDADKYIQEDVIRQTRVGSKTIVLPSERTGYRHLYVYDLNGKLLRKVGQDSIIITTISGYDESNGDIYFTAHARGPLHQQVFVSDRRGRLQMLSRAEGWSEAIFSKDFRYYINQWSDASHPYIFTLNDSKRKTEKRVIDNEALLNKCVEYGFAKPEFFSFTTSEGVLLNGYMIKPTDFDPQKKYPVVMFQYGGPGNQQVVNRWSIGGCGNGSALEQMLAQKGYISVVVDGRGTGGRGAAFEKCTYLRLGEKEAADQVETAIWLGQQPYVDKSRIGIWGWSYGGWNTLMSMSEGRAVFACGVAVAPPTNWRFYDTIYTERYMRTPKENPEGYDNISPAARVGNLHGSLLMVHGLADDNVHYQNTAEYVEVLVQADKDFRQLVYTNRNHNIYGGNTRTHLFRQILDFFHTELQEKK